LARIASTGIVLEETPWKKYAKQVVENARTIARIFREEGIPVHGIEAENFSEPTYCHQVITNYPIKEAIKLRDRLHKYHINVDGFVRIGTSEITRLGFNEKDCSTLAKILVRILKNEAVDIREIDKLIEAHKSVVL
jgi:glycine hydroxymethyltransferase